ncbi:hypothetical protein BKA64DRAFT_749152 [Cadophora sp. MPI-SDFR-AT-0126]|nr:hypothetical protein BKA64DRAFT_749152 [Leotiomycetes sp. MPI-SDFR-AT-0126]
MTSVPGNHVPRGADAVSQASLAGSATALSNSSLIPNTRNVNKDGEAESIPRDSIQRKPVPPQRSQQEEVEPTTNNVELVAEKSNILPLPRTRSFYTRISQDGWLWELVALFASIILLIGIVILLKVYNGRSLPRWPYGLTLNTLISILSNFATAAMMVSIAAGISQLKWLWFADGESKKRRLGDLQSFDEASRGSWGCVKLIKISWRLPLAVLGILVTLCSFMTGPMLQQAISYPLQSVVLGTASVPRSQNYARAGGNSRDDININPAYGADQDRDVTVAMQAAMLSGLSDLQTSFSNVSATCSTGNCTFDEYSTLGICASAANVSSFLSYDGSTGENQAILPNGHALLETGFYYMNATTFIDNSSSLGFPEASNILADIYIIYDPKNNAPSVAFEVMLQMCVQTYTTTVVSGVTNTTLVSTHNESSYSGTLLNISSPDGQSYFISDYARGPLQRALNSTFKGQAGNGQGMITVSSAAMQAFLSSMGGGYQDMTAYLAPVQSTVVGMTNSIRRDPGFSSELVGSLEAPGRAIADQVFIHVSWGWLALPFVLELLAVVFLLCVILKSRRRKVMAWKSSSLAILRGLSADIREALGVCMEENSTMEYEAESFDMRLDRDGDGWKLKLK